MKYPIHSILVLLLATGPVVSSPEKADGAELPVGAGLILDLNADKGVELDLYVNSPTAVASRKVPVNPKANSSLMAIGQERDATNHPGHESFIGEISRFVIYDRPLSDQELSEVRRHLMEHYKIGSGE